MGLIRFAIAPLFLWNAHAGTLALEDKLYTVTERPKEDCGALGGPEYLAKLTTMEFAQKNGEATAKALCKVKPKFCEANEQIKFGIKQVFTFVRSHPIRFKSTACQGLRDDCQKRCETTQLFSAEECLIECNQYESYNRD